MKLFDRVLNPREIRRRLGLNQEQFWTQIGVTQSGGSRYESGREMPKPVRELLRLVHVEQIDLSQVKRVDFEIISYLKESHADLYRTLRRAVKGRNKAGGSPLVLDDAALAIALHSRARFIGAMGSRRAQQARRERLLALGFSDEELARLSAPVGLDLGAVSAEETALSVLAEVVASRHGREGGRLISARGRIHQVAA